jgi:hypothetical protein
MAPADMYVYSSYRDNAIVLSKFDPTDIYITVRLTFSSLALVQQVWVLRSA